MNRVFVLGAGFALFLGIAGCQENKGGDSIGSMKMNEGSSMNAPPATKPAAIMYTCGMHSDVMSDKPGNCPKCGMKLVPKK